MKLSLNTLLFVRVVTVLVTTVLAVSQGYAQFSTPLAESGTGDPHRTPQALPGVSNPFGGSSEFALPAGVKGCGKRRQMRTRQPPLKN
jgi:hypothetical protein